MDLGLTGKKGPADEEGQVGDLDLVHRIDSTSLHVQGNEHVL